jgi:hypothetical protein
MRAITLFTAALTLSLVPGIAGTQEKTPKAKADEKADKARTERIVSRPRASGSSPGTGAISPASASMPSLVR